MEDVEIKIPSVVPAMTLQDVVLFPKAMMPLRIFEQKYRHMLSDALRGDRMFALVGLHEDIGLPRQDLFDIATVGLIRVSKTHDDGTSFVLLQGVERVKIRSIHTEEPYFKVEVEPFETEIDCSTPALREKLTLQLELNKKLGGDVTDEMLDFLSPLEDDITFVDLAAYSLCKEALRKQAMLETSNASTRANMLLEDLLRENERLSLLNEACGDSPCEDIELN